MKALLFAEKAVTIFLAAAIVLMLGRSLVAHVFPESREAQARKVDATAALYRSLGFSPVSR